MVGNLWKETCQLKEKISHDFFKLEAADQCEAGKKIVLFLRGGINCFTGPSRVAKEQRSKEFDAAKGMLKKFGLLKDIAFAQQRPKNPAAKRKGSGLTPLAGGGPWGGGISKDGKGKRMPGLRVKGKKCHKCGNNGHIRKTCPN